MLVDASVGAIELRTCVSCGCCCGRLLPIPILRVLLRASGAGVGALSSGASVLRDVLLELLELLRPLLLEASLGQGLKLTSSSLLRIFFLFCGGPLKHIAMLMLLGSAEKLSSSSSVDVLSDSAAEELPSEASLQLAFIS